MTPTGSAATAGRPTSSLPSLEPARRSTRAAKTTVPGPTDGELYDLLQKLFGLGDFDADLSTLPWWRVRALEVSKIKRSRTARRVELSDLILAAHYCKEHGHDVRAVTWLYKHIDAARRWDNVRRREAKAAELDELVAAAIEQESSHPDSPWLDRLVRARGPYRQEVYDSWTSARQA